MVCGCLILLFAIIFTAVGFKIKKSLKVPKIPSLRGEWWGQGQGTAVDPAVRPFKIEICQKVIDDLNHRLKNARSFTPPLESVQQQYGMNTKLLSEIVEFWKTKYNWREREKFLNQFPQFKTNIQGLDIHFLHVKPTSTEGLKVVPLLLVHGWPGSVREFYELIPLLTKPEPGKDFVFEVIAPSLPGFGFSDAACKPGLNPMEMGLIFKKLMWRLGFKQFYIQGGNWGGTIGCNMITLFPDEVQGAHFSISNVNSVHFTTKIKLLICNFIGSSRKKNRAILKKNMHFFEKESGYFRLQTTKPDTVGVGLNDSPVGLAAYLLEKFTSWTNPAWIHTMDGGLLEKFTYTKLLDNVMIYWVTNSITSAIRIYYENAAIPDKTSVIDRIPVMAPVAYARFQHEIIQAPNDVMKQKYMNLVHLSDIPNGGDFAAFEVPDVLAKDIWEAFEKFLDFYKSR